MSFVQVQTFSGAGPLVCSFTGATTGNALVVFAIAAQHSTGISAVTEGTSYTGPFDAASDTTTPTSGSVWYRENVASGTHSITVTAIGGGNISVIIFEVTGTHNGNGAGLHQVTPGTTTDAIKTGSTVGASGNTIVSISQNCAGISAGLVSGTNYTSRFSGALNNLLVVAESWDSISGAVDATYTDATRGGTDRYITFAIPFALAAAGGQVPYFAPYTQLLPR